MQLLILHLNQPVSNGIGMEKWLKYSKYRVFGKIFSYFLSGFAILVGLSLNALGLGAALNSASNTTSFERDRNGKVAQILEILSFWKDFEGFPVRIRYTSRVISKRTWVRCSIKFCIQHNQFRTGLEWKSGTNTRNTEFLERFSVISCLDSLC